jgi:hypothetical protein
MDAATLADAARKVAALARLDEGEATKMLRDEEYRRLAWTAIEAMAPIQIRRRRRASCQRVAASHGDEREYDLAPQSQE